MQLHGRLRLAAYLAPPLAVFSAIAIVACRDALTSNDDRNDARMTPHRPISEAAIRARQQLHEQNTYDWVGVAHNKALDEFRNELRKPGILSRNMCAFVRSFSAQAERLPIGHRSLDSLVRDEVARKSLRSSKLCRSHDLPVQRSLFRNAVLTDGAAPRVIAAYSDADALFGQIEAAVDVAVDSYDLATRLAPLLEQTSALGESDQAIVGAVISVAQSSREYWEVNYSVLVQEIGNEYGACAIAQANAGVSEEEAQRFCMEGGREFYDTHDFALPVEPYLRIRLAFDINDDLRQGTNAIVGADVKGAIAGAISGFWTGVGAVGTAIVGAGSSSIAVGVGQAWSSYWKIMGKK
jgi:hypothetical protein